MPEPEKKKICLACGDKAKKKQPESPSQEAPAKKQDPDWPTVGLSVGLAMLGFLVLGGLVLVGVNYGKKLNRRRIPLGTYVPGSGSSVYSSPQTL